MKMPELKWPPGVQPVIEADSQALADRLAHHVAGLLRQVLERDDRASLVVSGGSTPLAFFRSLRSLALDWKRVDLTLADERWVDDSSPESNGRLVRENLLQEAASAARFFPLMQAEDSARQGQAPCEAALAEFKWPIDVVILGMGNDGHTASLFPDAPELGAALDSGNPARTVALTPPSQARERLSLTRSALAGANNRILHIQGEDKLRTLEEAFRTPDQVAAMPVRAFIGPGLQVFWSP